MNRFEGKSVLVTGGSSGIGLAAAHAFIAEGSRVIITGRDGAALAEAKAALATNAIALRNDAGVVAEAKELTAALASQHIRLDAVFINAGSAKFAPLADVDEVLWDQGFDTNVKGAYFQIQALLPLLNAGASIVLNGSINAHIGMPNSSVYAASKAAMIPLGRFGTPQELASTVLHVAAAESAFIVGSEIVVDGGMSQL